MAIRRIKSLISLVTVWAFCFTVSAQAVELEHRGKEGVWFPAEMAKQMQLDIESTKDLESQLILMEDQLDLRAERIQVLKEATELAVQASERAKSGMENAIKLRLAAEERADSWYRSPYLWLGVGVGSTVLVELVAVLILGSLK